MKTYCSLAATLGFCLSLFLPGMTLLASDHADPQSVLNPFLPQDDPAANITDLHAFLADKDRRAIVEDPTLKDPKQRKADVQARLAEADQLIISLCVRRRLLHSEIADLNSTRQRLESYVFRVHMDMNPSLRHYSAADTRAAIAALDSQIALQKEKRDAAHQASPPMGGVPSENEQAEQAKLNQLLAARGQLHTQRQRDELMERLYGGIIEKPEAIAEEATLSFKLKFEADGPNSETVVVEPEVEGIPGEVNVVTEERKRLQGGRLLVEKNGFKPGAINVQGGIFDDPFIFPRFFRGNVVGIVISIPLDQVALPGVGPVRGKPVLLWATTHKPDGKVSDHVGRSLRTQLPRFGYLNGLHPSRQTAEIIRVHDQPTLIENILTAFIAPLEAHRHYDTTPDVMIYDLALPAKFPNGRWLADDVSKTLAENGETILYELACSESRQAPRATTNDKPFYATFPYLATRWTDQQIREHAGPGTTFGELNLGPYTESPADAKIAGTFTQLKGKRVPDAQDRDAVAPANLNVQVWRSIWTGLTLLLCALLITALLLARKPLCRFGLLVAGLFIFSYLHGSSCDWLRWVAGALVVFLGLVALIAASKLLQRCLIVLGVVVLLCLLWPAWWLVVKTWFLIALALVIGGALFTATNAKGRVFACVFGALALWAAWSWNYTPPPPPMMAAMPSMAQPPVPSDTPNDRFRRAILSGLLISGFGFYALYAWGVRRGIRRAVQESLPELGEQREELGDRQYDGSTFQEVQQAVLGHPYQERPLPVVTVSLGELARGMFSLSKRFLFKDAAQRTLDSFADLRWGSGQGVRRILHPNGICLTGVWEITEETSYTGYFAKGSQGLIVTRYSTGLGVHRGEKRTLSMVGKLYPTLNPAEKHRTASFITQDDLGAAYPEGIHDVLLRNAPNITVSKRFPDLGSLFLIGFTFFRVDMKNTIRQLYEIAELGKPEDVPTCCPQFMQLRLRDDNKVGGGDETADFRDEILLNLHRPDGTKVPLVFDIEVADQGEVTGLLDKKLEVSSWRKIGTITLDEAAASYNGDHVIHFHHPKWRDDVNKAEESGPSTAARFLNKLTDIYESVLRVLFHQKRAP
jgi:hypothetical protein